MASDDAAPAPAASTPAVPVPAAAAEPASSLVPGAAVRCERPQPVGVFPLPVGFLLVPGGAATAAVRRALAAGMRPTSWPEELAAIELAYGGDLGGALGRLLGEDVVTRYNRFVLRAAGGGSEEDPAVLRAELGPELGILVDVVRFAEGELDEPPQVTDETGEIAAVVWSAGAAHAMAAGRFGEAARMLGEGLAAAAPTSPGLAAQLMATAAGLRREAEGPTDEVAAGLAAALAALEPTDLTVGRAELHLALGSVHHEQAGGDMSGLRAAAEHYLAALRLITLDTAPELFASAQVSLAAAYLAMPPNAASDQLRLGVAMQGLRTALTVYTRETHPTEWSNTQLNLANALVHAPSTHRRDNLVEAVGRYQEVIVSREGLTSPLSYARVLASQGNALAQLGAFPQAIAVLTEARAIFEKSGDNDSVAVVRDVLDEIARQRTLSRST